MSRYNHKAQIRWELKGLNQENKYLKGDGASIRAQIAQGESTHPEIHC